MRQHKVRLDDGSEIALDLQAVKDWYAQGLLKRDSPVLKPGAKQWLPLDRALDLPSARRQAAAHAAAAAGVVEQRRLRAPAWRTVAAGILLLCAGTLGGFFWLRPERWLADLDPTPWRELSLGLVAAGLSLLRGWEWGRRSVRSLALVGALAVLPLGVILALKGVRFGPAFFVLAAVGALFLGFFLLLARSAAPWWRVTPSLLLILAGGWSIGRFGLVTETAEQRQVREALLADEAYADPAFGFRIVLRDGWRRLRPEQAAVTVPAAARVVLARPRSGGFAYLTAEDSPRGVLGPDDYLQRVLAERRASIPELAAVGRHEVTIGGLSGRGATAYRQAGGERVRDVTAVWRNGWTWFALVAWVPDDGRASAGRPLAALQAGFSHTPEPAQRLAQAVEAVTHDVPLLSPASAELLLRAGAARSPTPEQAVRQAIRLAALGAGALPIEETAELAALSAGLQARLASRDRGRVVAYLDKLRADQPTTPEEDHELTQLLKRGLLQLPSEQLTRLQDLYAKAIAAGLRG